MTSSGSRVRVTRVARAVAAGAALLAAVGCRREAPGGDEVAWSPGGTESVVRTTDILAGPPTPDSAALDPRVRNPFEGDARAVANGKALYEGFNCSGCHGSAGGGGIGPPFADADWIYGDEPENIFQSVAQGRPNGMPAFGGRIPEETLWMIVAYVRSLRPPEAKAAEGGG